MNLPLIIDVALGLIVLYLLLSTLCSVSVELLGAWRGWRKKMLREMIDQLLVGKRAKQTGDDPVLKAFWEHPRIDNLVAGGNAPSYLKPETFAEVVVNIALPKDRFGDSPETAEGIERTLRTKEDAPDKEPWGYLRRQLLDTLRLHRSETVDPLTQLRGDVARWYDDAMARLTGRYKRKMQAVLLWVALGVVVALNADSIRLAALLAADDSLRAAAAAYGESLATEGAPEQPGTDADADADADAGLSDLRSDLSQEIRRLQKIQSIGFPIGWQSEWGLNFLPVAAPGWLAWLMKAAGLAVTALAVSMGAPFWYDLLNKLVNIRSSGRRIPSQAEEQERQPRSAGGQPDLQTGSAVVAGAAGSAEASTQRAVVRSLKPRDIEADLAEPETSFNGKKGYWLAEAAHLAYLGDPDEVTKVVRDQWFFDEVSHFDDGQTTQAFLAASRRVAILAFRGTEGDQFHDWVTDARFKPEDFQTDYGRIHRGFRDALNSQYEAIRKAIQEFQGSGRLLYVTGHSLGASLATLMAARMSMDGVYPVQGVYTFGSPRVGDPAFAGAYKRELGERTFRVVNHDDLVTRVPTRSLGYRHVGQVIYFDADGAMHRDVGYWYRFLNLLANAVEDYKKAARTSIADHSMALYLKRFRGSNPDSGGSEIQG